MKGFRVFRVFRAAQRQLTFDDAQVMCGGLLDKDSFYAKLGDSGHKWIRDEDYAGMYSLEVGRPCVPPSILVRALILQNYRGCSDQELVERIRFDLRYKVALSVSVDYAGFDPSLLSVFRARLILHKKDKLAFEKTVEYARKAGLIGRVQPIDSMPIIGAAALQDTYTLIRTGIEKLLLAIRRQRDEWEGSRGFKYPFASKKYRPGAGKAKIDWNDEQQKREHLNELVKDASDLVEAVESSNMAKSELVQVQLKLLRRILAQDIEDDKGDGVKIVKGGKDRVISTNDPESRHGHKTSSKLIKGYKGHFIVSEQEIVTGVEVTPANAADTEPVEGMVDDLEARNVKPKMMPGDCGYAGADFRAAMEAKEIEILAKVPQPPKGERFPKSQFKIDLEAGTATCPAGLTTSTSKQVKDGKGRLVDQLQFNREQCAACHLRSQCIPDSEKYRRITLLFNENQTQKAKQRAAEPDFRDELKRRIVVERVQGRLQSYGLKKARYFGRVKTLLQALLTAAANNIWRITSLSARGEP